MTTQRTTLLALASLAGLAALASGCTAAATPAAPAPARPAPVAAAPAAAPVAAAIPVAPAAAPQAADRPAGKAVTPVDPAPYFVDAWGAATGFYATSPTGAIQCAITPGSDGGIEAGCTTTYQVKQLDCRSEERLNGPMASFDANGDLSFWCSGDGGHFLGGKVLPYGTSLTVCDYQLTSTRQGMVLSRADGTAVKINRGQGFVRTTVTPR